MKQARWVIQSNLLHENDHGQFQTACDNLWVECHESLYIPYGGELPKFPLDDKENIYYGSIPFIQKINRTLESPKGVFYNPETFSMENYLRYWGTDMLNYGAKVCSLGAFVMEDHPLDSDWFVRPDGDDKIFDGEVYTFEQIKNWQKSFGQHDGRLNKNTKIIAGEPYHLRKEWRNYIVDGKIVASTKYRENFNLKKCSEDIPKEMLEFTEHMLEIYQPHDVFTMDIAMTGGNYFIIECGCINNAGFYAANVGEIVKAITNYILK